MTSLLVCSRKCFWCSLLALGFCSSTRTPSPFGRRRSVLPLLILVIEGLPEIDGDGGSVLCCMLGQTDIVAVSSASFADGLGLCSMVSSLWFQEANDLCGLQCQPCHITTGQISESSCILPGTPFRSESNAVPWDSCWRM